MFPIRDHNPSDRFAIVSYGLIVTNVVVFLMYFPGLSGDPRLLMGFFGDWALTPAEVSRGERVETLFTSMFLHGGWLHLIGNMLFLWIFGDNLEDLLGHFGFLAYYIACGVAAGLGQMMADPSSTVPMVGASGAIAGVMGGYLLMFPRARIDVLVIIVFLIKIFTVPAWLMLGLWFALQLFSGVSMDAAGGGVAYWAHAGGFLAGAAFILPAWLKRGGPAFWTQTHGKPPHHEVEYSVKRRSSGIPKVHRVRTIRGPDDRPLSDLTRVPRSGERRGSGSPWSGGRD